MTPAQIQRNRQMVARLRADPDIQAMIKRNEFDVADAIVLVLDLNNPAKAHRHHITFQWCEKSASRRWRRRIAERRGYAILDRVIFEFEAQSDADACNEWLATLGW